MLSSEIILSAALGLSVPISVAIFKLVGNPKEQTPERRKVSEDECRLKHESMQILFDAIGRDLSEMKNDIKELNSLLRTKIVF